MKQFLVCLVVLLSFSIANADIVTFNFTGVVTGILRNDSNGTFGNAFHSGDPVSISYTIDTATPPEPDKYGFLGPNRAVYFNAGTVNYSISGYNFSGLARVGISNDIPGDGSWSGLSYDGFTLGPMTWSLPSEFSNFNPTSLFVQFFDLSGSMFNSTSLVTDLPFASLTQINGFRIDSKLNPDDWAGLNFTLNTAPVPIPGAVWLLGSGIVGLAALRRKVQK